MKIKTKMTVMVVAILLVGCGAAFTLLILRQQDGIYREEKEFFLEYGDNLLAALTTIMNSGDPKDIETFFAKQKQKASARAEAAPTHISVTDRNRKIVWDNVAGRANTTASGATAQHIEFSDAGGSYHLTESVLLESSCTRCHPGKVGEIIGFIDLEKSSKPVHEKMAASRNGLVLFALALMAAIGGAIVVLLNRLVFRRIDAVIDAATRVVGGDFDRPIACRSADEVGRLETLLEQFRTVFVSVVAQLESKNKGG
jgi:HAMP domain-containing protein